ncbi:hypothetical protein J2S19_003773 [Metabacillus malikii]|uniref:Uncharacterized protein n=1 Tax=Metabacillus malikii TaxID=1504265 RepID=A0ABT9ZL04_9BACI|nr:hypothetical protein [Metabacillus malikii]
MELVSHIHYPRLPICFNYSLSHLIGMSLIQDTLQEMVSVVQSLKKMYVYYHLIACHIFIDIVYLMDQLI